MLDDDFGLSEGETSDEEGEGNSSYLGGSIIDPNNVLSMSRFVAADLPSSEAILSDFINGEEDTRGEESSLIG